MRAEGDVSTTRTEPTPQHTPTPHESAFGRLCVAVITEDYATAREIASLVKISFPDGAPAVLDDSHAALVEALANAFDWITQDDRAPQYLIDEMDCALVAAKGTK